jgi:serine O-acetyltransferase
MKFREYKYLVWSDFYRITGNFRALTLVLYILFGGTFRYCFWMRTCRFTRHNRLLGFIAFPFARIMLHRLTYKLGISIPFQTEIGSGLCIAHCGDVTVNGRSVIGKNCNISQGVTVGQANRGRNKGYPTLGDNVYIGPGAKIVGGVKIGNNVAIGANCVVTRDVPDDSVVVGVPGKVISRDGAKGYVNRIDYEDKLKTRGIYSINRIPKAVGTPVESLIDLVI